MIAGEEQPDSGTLKLGSTVQLSYVDQHRHDLGAENTVFQEVTGGTEHIEVAGKTINSRAYVGRFNFKGPDQQKKVGELSGGERNRVHLAKLLRCGGNVLLLDEPTASLDPDVGDNIRKFIEEFASNKGTTILLASHNMNEVERLCDEVMMMKDGRIIDSGKIDGLINKLRI